MKKAFLALFCASLFLAPACYTLNHTVGAGAKGGLEKSERQWYALFGLVPLGKLDSKTLAGDAKDYSVQTQWTPIDILINLVTGLVTITSRTVTVTQ